MHYGMFIVMPDFGEWIKFNKRYSVGMNFNTKNSKQCAEKIQALNLEYLQDVSIRNCSTLKKNFIWSKEVDKLIDFYKEITK